MTHARESIPVLLMGQFLVVLLSLGIAIRVAAASIVFGLVHGPPRPDRETAISLSISGPSITCECWSALDELQAAFLAIAAMVFFYGLHALTAADNVLVVWYLLSNVAVVAVPGILQTAETVLYRSEDNKPLLNT